MLKLLPPSEPGKKWVLLSSRIKESETQVFHNSLPNKVAEHLLKCGFVPDTEPTEVAVAKALDINLGSYRYAWKVRYSLECELSRLASAAEATAPPELKAYYHAQDRVLQAERAVSAAEGDLKEAEKPLLELLRRELNLDPSKVSLALGFQTCFGSPIRVCVYDDNTDWRHDSCLICHEPEERK